MSDDWDTVTVLRKRPANAAAAKSEHAVNAARRSGAAVDAEKKFAGGSNKTSHRSDIDTAKLDRETDELKHKLVDVSVGKAMRDARASKTPAWTQKDLAVKVNEKPQIIQEYESGKAMPNQQILGKLERALGVKLRGKDIGAALTPRGAK